MNFSIRQLELKDFTENSGFVATMANMSDISNLDFGQLKKILQQAKQVGIYFFVAISEEEESKGQIISTVKLIIEPKFFHGGRSAGHIEDVVTRLGFEGQGLAKALLQEAIKTAKANNCYKIILDCKKELIDFYSQVGFKNHDVCMRLDIK